MAVDDILGSEVLVDAVTKAVANHLAGDIPLYEKCTDVSKAIYDSVKGACHEHGVVVYLVNGSWRGVASEAFSAMSGRPRVFRDHAHDWLMFADADVFVHTIKNGLSPPNNDTGPRQEGSAYFDVAACQFTGEAWSFEACFGSDVEAALIQEKVWTIE